MTRDEAITKAVPALVDALVALGLLKLDEPKTVEQRLDEAVRARHDMGAIYLTSANVMATVKSAGLKIVEADK